MIDFVYRENNGLTDCLSLSDPKVSWWCFLNRGKLLNELLPLPQVCFYVGPLVWKLSTFGWMAGWYHLLLGPSHIHCSLLTGWERKACTHSLVTHYIRYTLYRCISLVFFFSYHSIAWNAQYDICLFDWQNQVDVWFFLSSLSLFFSPSVLVHNNFTFRGDVGWNTAMTTIQ